MNAITILLDLLFKPYAISPESFTRFNNEKKMWFEYTFKIDGHSIVYSFEFDRIRGITDEKLTQDGEKLLDRQIGSAKSFITENTDYDEVDRNTLFLRNIYFNTKFAGRPILNKWFEYMRGYLRNLLSRNSRCLIFPKTILFLHLTILPLLSNL